MREELEREHQATDEDEREVGRTSGERPRKRAFFFILFFRGIASSSGESQESASQFLVPTRKRESINK